MLPPERTRTTLRPAMLSRSRKRAARGGGTGAFRHVVGVGEIVAHGGTDVVLARGDDALGAGIDLAHRVPVRHTHRHAIGDGVALVGRDGCASGKGTGIAGSVFGHHANHGGARRHCIARPDGATQSRAQPDRHIDRVDVVMAPEDFETVACDPADKVVVE